MPGPAPKRSEQRRRRNHVDVDSSPAGPTVPEHLREPDERWHELAQEWFRAAMTSGQVQFYELSDVLSARLLAESLSRDLFPRVVGTDGEGEPIERAAPLNGTSLSAYLRMMGELLMTEASRRRAGVELQRGETGPDVAEQAAQSKVTDARARFEKKTG